MVVCAIILLLLPNHSFIIHHSSIIIHHSSFIIHHSSFIIHHSSFIIHRSLSFSSRPTIAQFSRDRPLSLIRRTSGESKRATHTPALLILRDGERQGITIHRLCVGVGGGILGVVDESLRHLLSGEDVEGEGVHRTGVVCVGDVGHGDGHGLHIHEGLLRDIHMVVANGDTLVMGNSAHRLALVKVVCRHTQNAVDEGERAGLCYVGSCTHTDIVDTAHTVALITSVNTPFTQTGSDQGDGFADIPLTIIEGLDCEIHINEREENDK